MHRTGTTMKRKRHTLINMHQESKLKEFAERMEQFKELVIVQTDKEGALNDPTTSKTAAILSASPSSSSTSKEVVGVSEKMEQLQQLLPKKMSIGKTNKEGVTFSIPNKNAAELIDRDVNKKCVTPTIEVVVVEDDATAAAEDYGTLPPEPKDTWNMVYCIFVIHGIGMLIAWNIFIMTEEYFTKYKFSQKYIGYEHPITGNFLQLLTFCSQIPSLAFQWMNIFIKLTDQYLELRIMISVCIIIMCCGITMSFVVIDTASWPTTFLVISMCLIIIIHMSNGIYQNTVFGMAAILPSKYTGAIFLGINVSGIVMSLISILSLYLATNIMTSTLYCFSVSIILLIFALFTLLQLQNNHYFNYFEHRHDAIFCYKNNNNENDSNRQISFSVLLNIILINKNQLFNVFNTLFVTLSIFPSILGNIHPNQDAFTFQKSYFVQFLFFTFNLFATLGTLTSMIIQWPKANNLWILTCLRFLFIPYFLFSNYHVDSNRVLVVYFHNDYILFMMTALLAFTSGYISSLAMMYISQQAPFTKFPVAVSGMVGSAFLASGIFAGIILSFLWPKIITISN